MDFLKKMATEQLENAHCSGVSPE
ncbi:hypothetical protein C358_05634 [Cryptococcus neoformans MW-RSA852]|nr:hypothetical protein C358_05634 [Cryptococcus neoformans var. grubii MW-RSA852]